MAKVANRKAFRIAESFMQGRYISQFVLSNAVITLSVFLHRSTLFVKNVLPDIKDRRAPYDFWSCSTVCHGPYEMVRQTGWARVFYFDNNPGPTPIPRLGCVIEESFHINTLPSDKHQKTKTITLFTVSELERGLIVLDGTGSMLVGIL